MALPNNTLQQVQTYQESNLAYLLNLCCFITTANTKFKDFDRMEANLGSTVTFDLPPRYLTSNTLVANFQSSVQRVQPLTVDQAKNTSYAFSAQQFVFNVRDYMDKFGKSATLELANAIEANIALNAISGVPVGDINGNPTGGYHTESGPYRFFGDGVTPINSYQQLAQMITNFKNYGAVKDGIKVYLPDVIIPGIVGTGLNQFAPRRNDDIAMSWEVGSFGTPPVDYYQSNLLPIHYSGNVGEEGTTLTVTAVNDATGVNVTQITFSGASASDANAIKAGDLFYFVDGVSGHPNLRFLTFIGHVPSAQQVQFRATADAASDGSGNVTVTLVAGSNGQGLTWAATQNQNLNNPIQVGMQVKSIPSHRAGLVVGGDALYLAMPTLPNQEPFPTSSKVDPDTGVSLRMYWGTLFGQNQQGFVHDCIWASTVVPEYSMRVVTPI